MFNLSKTSLFFVSTSVAFAATVFYPKSATISTVRSTAKALKIEVRRESPAYAAFQDLSVPEKSKELKSEAINEIKASEKSSLYAGARFKADVYFASTREALGETTRELKPMVVQVNEGHLESPTLSELAETLVQKELDRRERAQQLSERRRLNDVALVKRISRDPFTYKRVVVAPEYKKRKPNQPTLSALARKRNPPKEASGFVSHSDEESATSLVAMNSDGVQINGTIEFVNGMAFDPTNDRVSIFHEINGVAHQAGEFYFHRGQYQITVKTLTGELIAEVRTRDGQIIGRGALPIGTSQRQRKIRVEPAESALRGEVVVATTSGARASQVKDSRLFVSALNREIVPEYKTKEFIDKDFRLGSFVQATASAPGHWSTSTFIESGSPFQIGLFSNQTVKALLDLTTRDKFESRDAETKAIIWGRVTVAGRPIADATVRLTSEPSAQAVYFSGPLPNRLIGKTSENGEFIFVNIEPGPHTLQATVNGEAQLPINILTEARALTHVDFEFYTKREIEVGVYDYSRPKQYLPFRMQFLGDDQFADFYENKATIKKINLPRGLSLVEFDPGVTYSKSRLLVQGKESSLVAPALPADWPRKFGKNILAGEFSGDNYTVLIFDQAGRNRTEQAKTIYLNEAGETTNAVYGEDGQRFIVTGLDAGFYTLIVLPSNSKDLLSFVTYVDSEAITYVKKSLFDL